MQQENEWRREDEAVTHIREAKVSMSDCDSAIVETHVVVPYIHPHSRLLYGSTRISAAYHISSQSDSLPQQHKPTHPACWSIPISIQLTPADG